MCAPRPRRPPPPPVFSLSNVGNHVIIFLRPDVFAFLSFAATMTPEAWMMFLHNMMSLAFCFFQRQLHLYIEWLNEGSLLLRLQQQSHLDFNDVTAQLEGSLPSVSFSNNVAWICWPSLTPTTCTALKERSRRWSTLQPACIRVKHPPLSSVKVKYTNSDFPNTLLRVGNRLFFFF